MADMPPLMLIEWEDSAQPVPGWAFTDDIGPGSAVRCASVGWLLHDGDVKVLMPNIGGLEDDGDLQASGTIRIPASCIIKATRLSCPSSRLGRARKRRGS